MTLYDPPLYKKQYYSNLRAATKDDDLCIDKKCEKIKIIGEWYEDMLIKTYTLPLTLHSIL